MYEKKKLFFAFILGLFFVVKILWVVLPTFSMGIPRLGDDSLVYLWAGKASFDHNQVSQQGIKDIAAIRESSDVISKETDYSRARVTMRTAGVSASPLYIGMGYILNFGVTQKTLFAIMEISICLLLGFGLAYFLSGLVGASGTSFALGLLIFSIFPNQGIHYLIPSVCALAIFLILLRVVFFEGVYFYKFVLGFLLLFIHTIGQVYLLFSIMLIFSQQLVKDKFSRDGLYSIALLVFCAILFRLITPLIGAIQPPTSGMGGINLSQYGSNFIGFFRLLSVFVTTQPLMTFFTSLGCLIILFNFRKNINLSLTWGGFLILLFASLLVDIPGYPADLASRVLVPFVILCLGISGKWIFEKLKSKNSMIFFVLASAVIVVFTQVPYFLEYFFTNLNSRYQVLNENILEKDLKKIQIDSKIIWLDSDTQMMTGFLKGAAVFNTIPYIMVAKTKMLHDMIAKSNNFFYVLPYPESLNGLSAIQSRSLEPRYYGYGFDHFESISVLSDKERLGRIYIRTINALPEDFIVFSGSSENKCSLEKIKTSNNKTWFMLSGCNDSLIIDIKSVNQKVKLIGLSFDLPRNELSWPWGRGGFKLIAKPRDKNIQALAVRFDLEWLLGKSAYEDLQPYLNKSKIIKDEGGFIWAQYAH